MVKLSKLFIRESLEDPTMRKLLFITESSLIKKGEEYFAKDTWVKFPLKLSDQFDLRILSPINTSFEESEIERRWAIEKKGAEISPLPNYYGFFSFLKQYLLNFRDFNKIIDKELSRSEIIAIRLPSPVSLLFFSKILALRKPFVLFVGGNIETQVDQYLLSSGLKKIFYSMGIKLISKIEGRLASKANFIFVYSEEIYHRFKGLNKHIKQIRTPVVGLDEFYFREDTCLGKEIKIIRVCWIIQSKGLEYLIDAIKILVGKGYNVSLSIIGDAKSESYKRSIMRRIADLELDERINILGWIPTSDIPKYFVESDIHVISSLSEGTPRVIIEGASRGTPLIATNVGGISNTLENKKNALLIDPSSEHKLAEAIELMIEEELLRKEIISNAYDIAKTYSFENFVPEITKILNKF